MKRKIFAICSVLVSAIVLIAVLIPGCDGVTCIGEIEVKATLCDAPWEGDVQYTLTGPGATAAPITGTNVTALFDNVECGNWTCAYVSGGPPGAYLVDITSSPTQEVTNGAVITFTLNFELDQDASIDFLTWTINGVPIEEWEGEWGYEDGQYHLDVWPGDIIDVHYAQRVDGCEGRVVKVKETSELWLHWVDYEGAIDEPFVHVANNWCAVVKDPPPVEKVSQVPSFNGEPVEYCEIFYLPLCHNVTLDVETIWLLEKPIEYRKTINWLHIGECEPEPPCCTLFELLLFGDPGASAFWFQMHSCATVELMDDEDVNPENNTACGPPLNIYYYTPGPM